MAIPQLLLMKSAVPASILALAAGTITGGAAAPANLQPPHAHALALANRLEATFTEKPSLSRTADCTAAPKICQAVLHGRGSLEGFGPATEIAGLTQDGGVTPCGPRSDSETATRRIMTAAGVLALRASGVRCPTAAGFRVKATYTIDGAASTGLFAGARGHGHDTTRPDDGSIRHVTLSGTLKVRRP